jgi:hypothetical protein
MESINGITVAMKGRHVLDRGVYIFHMNIYVFKFHCNILPFVLRSHKWPPLFGFSDYSFV